MKINLPVTQHECDYPDNIMIVSKTDTRGIITYINQDFIEISGYDEQELLGKSHNIIRHPDMPPAAFEDLWNTVKAGRPWTGLVKNRCKNGDHYWVEANVTPLCEDGHVVGYMSVRSKPTRGQIEQASQLYRQINENKSPKTSLLSRFNMLNNITIKSRLIAIVGLLSALLLGIGYHGLHNTGLAEESLRTVYVDRVLALDQLKVIADMYAVNIVDTAHKTRNGNLTWIQGLNNLVQAENKIAENWKAYTTSFLIEDEKKLIAQTQPLLDEADRTVTRLKGIMEKQDSQAIEAFTINELYPKIDPISEKISELAVLQLAVAKSEYEMAVVRSAQNRIIAWVIIPGGILIAILLGFTLLRAITRPLDEAFAIFHRMAEGDLNVKIDIKRRDEISKILEAAKAMQIKLGFDLSEAKRISEENLRVKIALDTASTNVMIADNDRKIIYMNKSVGEMLARSEADIRKALPNFNVSQLLGSSIDQFHKNPAHQHGLLASFTNTHRTQIQIGTRTFALAANPVMNERGERMGSVVEWNDRTAEVAVEREIADIINAAGQGDFTKRIELSNKEGFFYALGEGINTLLETSNVSLNEVVRVLNALSQGDLTEKITNECHGMFRQLKDDSNATVENLSKLVQDIKSAVDSINTAAREISAGNADLSHRTEEQAASLEETAASMEQLAATVKQNVDNARQANQMAVAASDVAVKGGNMVQQVVGTMSAINESSRKIVDIISVIDGIALQTNILALNAAVEAARAGEQGRGFAVVASEVRNLAQRSAAAAKEIKRLISDSVEQVEGGTKLVGEAGKTMDEIVTSVKRVTDIMSEIAAASVEQSSGIDQVNQAVTQMDETTQQNAALVEQAAAAAESLEEQAGTLSDTVAQFHLDSAAWHSQPAPRRAASWSPVVHKSARRMASSAAKPSQQSDEEWAEF